jgi:hypothetical protein
VIKIDCVPVCIHAGAAMECALTCPNAVVYKHRPSGFVITKTNPSLISVICSVAQVFVQYRFEIVVRGMLFSGKEYSSSHISRSVYLATVKNRYGLECIFR